MPSIAGLSVRQRTFTDQLAQFNAVAEPFFSNLKKERIKRRIYASRQEAKSEVFDDMEGSYNRVRRHSHLDQVSPLAFEQLQTGI